MLDVLITKFAQSETIKQILENYKEDRKTPRLENKTKTLDERTNQLIFFALQSIPNCFHDRHICKPVIQIKCTYIY